MTDLIKRLINEDFDSSIPSISSWNDIPASPDDEQFVKYTGGSSPILAMYDESAGMWTFLSTYNQEVSIPVVENGQLNSLFEVTTDSGDIGISFVSGAIRATIDKPAADSEHNYAAQLKASLPKGTASLRFTPISTQRPATSTSVIVILANLDIFNQPPNALVMQCRGLFRFSAVDRDEYLTEIFYNGSFQQRPISWRSYGSNNYVIGKLTGFSLEQDNTKYTFYSSWNRTSGDLLEQADFRASGRLRAGNLKEYFRPSIIFLSGGPSDSREQIIDVSDFKIKI